MVCRMLPKRLLAMHTYDPASSSDTLTIFRVLLKFSNFTFRPGRSPPFLNHLMVGVGLWQRRWEGFVFVHNKMILHNNDNRIKSVSSQSCSDALQQQFLVSQHHLGALGSWRWEEGGCGLCYFAAWGHRVMRSSRQHQKSAPQSSPWFPSSSFTSALCALTNKFNKMILLISSGLSSISPGRWLSLSSHRKPLETQQRKQQHWSD